MKTNRNLKPHIPYARHTYQTNGELFVRSFELDKSNRRAVKAQRSQDAREMARALMIWGDDGGKVVRIPTNQQKKMEKNHE
ncbi:MAG: hypothetical protein WAS33_06195 [Candidatus Promineifilaceae bacterium]|nr:hypothetical protein [Anaerolineaceae bacterium]